MKRQELLIWAAGMTEGCGSMVVRPEQGPSKQYLSITISYPVGGEGQLNRLMAVVSNGALTPLGSFELSGYAAVMGYLKELWPYLSAEGRSQMNEVIRYYKATRKEHNLAQEDSTPDTSADQASA